MADGISAYEAGDALDTVAQARQQVADERGLPRTYWCGLAAGWVVVGVVADLGHPWLTTVTTFVFGMVHAALAGRLLSGRQRTRGLRVNAAVAGQRTPIVVIGMLVALAVATSAAALALNADGMRHPAAGAAVLVAVVAAVAGPGILRALLRVSRA